jgi:hypothetical protein
VAENDPTPSFDIWLSVVIIGRVVLMLGLWITLFLMIFLGYFTVPILIIGAVTILYMVSDLGMFVVVRRHRQALQQRKVLLENPPVSEEQQE